MHIRVLALALAGGLSSLAGAQSLPAQTADAAFKEALFRASQDHDVVGRAAADLYWEADALQAFKSDSREMNAKFNALYRRIDGKRIARARLTESGWSVTAPRAEYVLASGEPYEAVLLLENATETPQSFVARLSGTAGQWQQQVELVPGESRAIYPTLVAHTVGRLDAAIEFTGRSTATVPLRGEIRAPARLRLRIVDSERKVTAARVYVRDASERSHTPAGAFDRVMWMTAEHYFYSPGEVDLVLPAGRAEIEVRKGFDYLPAILQVELSASGPNRVEVRLNSLREMRRDGWVSGDDHIHNNYTGEQWSTPENARLIVAGEGLHVGNMMVSNSVGGTIHDERYFEGRPNGLSTADQILYWNQEMRTWSYGHLLLLGLTRLVRPLYTGFPEATHWEDYPSNLSQAEQARQEGGVALYAHPALRFSDIPSGSLAGESVVDVALGAIDAIEVFCSHDEPSMELWYRFLNLGFKLGISGGSDAFLNNRFAFLAGGERVYVYTGDRFGYPAWIDGLKNGRTFATVGPLLTFDVAGKISGTQLRFDGPTATLPVHVEAVSSIPMSRIEIVVNGRVAAEEARRAGAAAELQWSGDITLNKSSWVAARVWGPHNDRISNGPSRWSERRSSSDVLLAHTSPVYVSIRGKRVFSPEDREFCLRWIDSLTERIRKDGKFANDKHRHEVLASFARARQTYARMGDAHTGDKQ